MKKIAASARNRQNAKNIASYIEFMKGDKYMTKADLMKEFKELETEKRMHIDGIYWNSKKSEIQNAIDCLKCQDEMLEKYLMIVILKYPNSGRIIAENGDFKRHSFNRLYIYNTARMILAN